ncbi:[protein-PII] uridylyltransferase [Pseudomonadota bacterium]
MPELATIFDEKAFEASLKEAQAQNTPPVQVFREALNKSREKLAERFYEGADTIRLVTLHSELIDHLLHKIWKHHFNREDKSIALVAVGGYGRGELHPKSDVDILILLKENNHDDYSAELEGFVMFLWDLGLEIGHSVRSLEECVEQATLDITIATNLMEARLLVGDQSLFDEMRATTGPDQIWPGKAFFKAKWEEQILRHHKYDDTAYNLEPNIKEGPGGLRDIQMIGWVAKRHFNADTLHDLVIRHFLTEDEYIQLVEGQTFLWRIRFALHAMTKRHEDRLLFDYQRTLAEDFGYQTDAAGLAVEKFMRQYYLTIMGLSRLNEMLLQLFQEAILYTDEDTSPQPINKRFQIRKGFIEVTHDNVFKRTPFALLEIFHIIQMHPDIKGVRASTIRLIFSHRHLIDDTFRQDLRNRSIFMDFFRDPSGLTHTLRRMNRYGILGNYLPSFGKIVGLMQYDLFHIFTVDEHILMVIRNLRRLTISKHDQEQPFCSKLVKEIPKPEILYLSALFHDIAKGRGGDHSELGTEDAMQFCLQHDMSNYDARFVAWLVKHHLLMSATAQRKDISDPDVINEFSSQVGDITHLNYLYLLTIADIRGTNKTLWNSWKDSLLYELYLASNRVLRRGIEKPIDQSELIDESKARAINKLNKAGITASAAEKLWAALGNDYFLRHNADEIAWHTEAIISNDGKEFPLILVQQEARGGTQIFIHMPDSNHLFATATRTMDQLGLTVMDARIITSDKGYTLDTYIVLEESGQPIEGVHRISDILAKLKQELSQTDFKQKSVNRCTARQLKHFHTQTQISFSCDQRNHRTILEVITADRPGLLSDIGRGLMECDIHLQNAKISTIGERVEDVFFIVNSEHKPVNDEKQLGKLKEVLTEYLDS